MHMDLVYFVSSIRDWCKFLYMFSSLMQLWLLESTQTIDSVYVLPLPFSFQKIEAAHSNTCKCKEQKWKVPSSTPRWCSWLPIGFCSSHGSPLWSSEYSIQFYFCIPKRPHFDLVWPAGWPLHCWPCQAKKEDCWRFSCSNSPIENAGWQGQCPSQCEKRDPVNFLPPCCERYFFPRSAGNNSRSWGKIYFLLPFCFDSFGWLALLWAAEVSYDCVHCIS